MLGADGGPCGDNLTRWDAARGRRHQEVGAEEKLEVTRLCGRVIGVLIHHRPHDGHPVLDVLSSCGIKVGVQRVPKLQHCSHSGKRTLSPICERAKGARGYVDTAGSRASIRGLGLS